MNKLYLCRFKALLFFVVLIGIAGCSDKPNATDVYKDVLSKVLGSECEKNSGCTVGSVSGLSNFSYNLDKQTITVNYGVVLPGENYIERLLLENYTWYKEKGTVSSLSIKGTCGFIDGGNYYPVSIQGRWKPQGSGGGRLVIGLSKDNRLDVYIFGDGNWKYWISYELSQHDAEAVLNIMNEAWANSEMGKKAAKLYELFENETDFVYEKGKDKVFIELDPDRDNSFYEYLVNDTVIVSRKALSFSGNMSFSGGRFLHAGDIEVTRGCIKYKPENGKPAKFLPAGFRLKEIKSRILPEDYKWVNGKWLCWPDNNHFYELRPDGGLLKASCHGEKTYNETEGVYFFQKKENNSVSLLLCEDGTESHVGIIEAKAGLLTEENALKLIHLLRTETRDVKGGGQAQVDIMDTTYYYKFPEWIEGVWSEGRHTITIKSNVVYDPGRICSSSSDKYDSTIGSNLLLLRRTSDGGVDARLFIDRENQVLGVLDSEDDIHWLYKVPSSPITILEDLYSSTNKEDRLYSYLHITTDRFRMYESTECDYDLLHQTQDDYTYVENPNPVFVESKTIKNAYLVEWTRSADEPRVRIIVVFTRENGLWKIDNVIEHPEAENERLRFDYSKPPVSIYE